MDEKETPILTKIEIDEKTSEPVIVEISPENGEDKATAGAKPKKPKYRSSEYRKEDKEYRKSLGKQIVMKQVLGYIPDTPSTTKRQKLFKRIFTAVFVVVVLAVLVFTAYNDFFSPEARENPVSWESIGNTISANWYYLLLAMLALLGCFFFKGLKLSVMCKSMTGKWRLLTCMETGVIGHYYNNVTPLAAGGQPFEIYHLSRHGVHGGVAASMPIAAFFLYQCGFVALSIFAVIAFVPGANVLGLPDVVINSSVASTVRPLAIIGMVFGMVLPTTVLIFCILPRLGSKLVGFAIGLGAKLKIVRNREVTTMKTMRTVLHNSRCLKSMGTNPIVFIVTFLISVAEVLSQCSIAYFTLKFFGFDFASWGDTSSMPILNWLQIVQVCLVLYQAISFIPTPGNSGAADISFYWLFKLGLSSGFAFPAMITWRILAFYAFIIIGFAFTNIKRKTDRRKEKLGIPLYKE